MAQRAASYGAAVLHKGLTMKHCFRLHFITPRQAAQAPQYEAASFYSAMKHSAIAPCDLSSIALCATYDLSSIALCATYDLSSIALRATDDEKIKK